MYRIDFLPAIKSTDGTKLTAMHLYEPPIFGSEEPIIRFPIPASKVAVFSRLENSEWIIWKIKS